jgi:hypothetical protein
VSAALIGNTLEETWSDIVRPESRIVSETGQYFLDTLILPVLYVTDENERAGNETHPPEARPNASQVCRAPRNHGELRSAPGAERDGDPGARGAVGPAAVEDQQAGDAAK